MQDKRLVNLKRGNPNWGRKADGTGKSGNPKGGIHKVDCLLSCIKEELTRVSLNGITTNEQLIARVLVGMATQGNVRAIELMMGYLHARPTAGLELSTKDNKPLPLLIEVIDQETKQALTDFTK